MNIEAMIVGAIVTAVVSGFLVRGWWETRRDSKDEDKELALRISEMDKDLTARIGKLEIEVAVMKSKMVSSKDVEDLLDKRLKPIGDQLIKLSEKQDKTDDAVQQMLGELRIISAKVTNGAVNENGN